MKVYIKGHDFKYETEKLIRIFLPFERVDFSENSENADILLTLAIKEDVAELFASVNIEGKKQERSAKIEKTSEKEYERELAVLLYKCFVDAFGVSSRWGILTGVRPAKLFSRIAKSKGLECLEFCMNNGNDSKAIKIMAIRFIRFEFYANVQ